MLCAHAQSISYGFYTGSEPILNWGTSKAETYSVAMKVDEPSLVGTQVKALRIPVVVGADNASEYSAFITKELKATGGKATGDIANVEFTPSSDWVEVTLPQPYTITEEPFYVGYTLKVTSCTAGDLNCTPLCVIAGMAEGALNIVTSRTYRKWTDVSGSIGGELAMQIVVEGGTLRQNAASVADVQKKIVKRGTIGSARATIQNHGVNDITSIDYTYSVQGKSVSKHVDLNLSHDYYGVSTNIDIEIPAMDETGDYQGLLTITKVNDVPNTSTLASKQHDLRVMNIVPVKRPLMEEFTGTWCGFCPSGFTGMRLMNERHPDMFVCASYHNGDAMQVTEQYPIAVSAFPTSFFDRNHFTDPYTGDARKDMGIDITWQRECQEYTPVNVNVMASLDTAEGLIEVNAEYEFCESVEGIQYGVAYIITEDGVTGRGTLWRQHNYFSKDYEEGMYSGMYNEGMEQFNDGPEYLYLEYDDVVIAQSHDNGATVDDLIGSSVAELTVLPHTFTFRTADMVANYGPAANLIQNPARLHAIALVYDRAAGHVVNCAKCDVVPITGTGGNDIANMTSAPTETPVTYNLSGQRVNEHHKGIVIRGGKKFLMR